MTTRSEGDVIQAIEGALELKSGSLKAESKAEDFEAWDSLGQLSVLMALDQLFDGKVADIPDMATASSVPEILERLRAHSLI